MEFTENDEYNPVPPTYYNYKGTSLLTLDYKNQLFEYYNINIFGYTINNEKKHPFQQILLARSATNSELIKRIHRIMTELDLEVMPSIEFKKLGYANRNINNR